MPTKKCCQHVHKPSREHLLPSPDRDPEIAESGMRVPSSLLGMTHLKHHSEMAKFRLYDVCGCNARRHLKDTMFGKIMLALAVLAG